MSMTPSPKALSFAALAAAALLALAPLKLAAQQPASPPTITVTGTGDVARAPDTALISLGVTTQGKTAGEALGANSKAMTAVIERLKAAGVPEADLRTDGLSVNPQWESGYSSARGGENGITGFVAGNMLTVRVDDLDKLGALVDASVADGANTLNGVQFGLSEPAPARNEARKLAVADARATAELLAEAAGVKLGRILLIAEEGHGGGGMPMFRAAAAEAASVPVQRGEISTGARVSVTWELAQ